jgi:dipeptidyl aminopeptidase/acylaminoacyl peptidase
MGPEDVYELVGVSDPRISPDGRTCAYVLTTIDREESKYLSAVWLVPIDGSEPARRFSFGTRRDSSPRWAPDGERLAFLSNRDNEKAAQLYVIPIEGGEAVKLTDLKESVEEVTWSPDGTRIAFTSRVPDEAYDEEEDRKRAPRHITGLRYKLESVGWTFDRRKQVFVVPSDGSAQPRQITDGNFEHSSPAWSPDGKRIAFASARHRNWDIDTATDIYVIGSRGGRPQKLTATDGGCGLPSWSPEGRRIAYTYNPGLFDSPRHSQIAVLDVNTRKRRVLTSSLDRNCAPFMTAREPIWVGNDVFFVAEDRGTNPIYRVSTKGSSEPRLIRRGQWTVAGYDVHAGVGVHVRSRSTALPELYFGDKRLTRHGDAFAKSVGLNAPERFTATSADGSKVDAWIVRPDGFVAGRRYPVLLNIHGGPFTQYGVGFFDEFSVYTGAGYVVVYSNPRGSSGYSEAWGRAICGPVNGEGPGWGTRDYEDLMAVTDEALRRFDFCDPKRVGVMGGSYGGYMTSWMVGHTDRFKAAVSERAVNTFYSEHGSSDIGWLLHKAYTGAYLHEDPEEYLLQSPLSYAERIKTPLLILHSDNDLRCPVDQAEQLFTILRLLKRDVELVRFPSESHELTRSGSPRHRVQRFEIILDWFDRKLKK